MEIEIISKSKSPQELRGLLETNLDWEDSYGAFRVRVSTREILSDPAVVVTIVGALGTALGALIAGLLQVVQKYYSEGEIILEVSDKEGGSKKIVAPRGTSPDKIDALIQKLDKMGSKIEKIIVP